MKLVKPFTYFVYCSVRITISESLVNIQTTNTTDDRRHASRHTRLRWGRQNRKLYRHSTFARLGVLNVSELDSTAGTLTAFDAEGTPCRLFGHFDLGPEVEYRIWRTTIVKSIFGIFNSDAVNLQGKQIPVRELSRALEKHLQFSVTHRLPLGAPVHLAHDLHRLVGWSRTLGVFLEADLAQEVGFLSRPESDDEKHVLPLLQYDYLRLHEQEYCKPYEAHLRGRLTHALHTAEVKHCAATVLCQNELAVKTYPDLFGSADKDGLLDYRMLISRFDEVHPGIFRDSTRELLLFAHPYMRRSLSRLNNLNEYFLKDFGDLARSNPNLTMLLRLDPDIVGAADSFIPPLEFEYIRGPKFDAHIDNIPAGVTEHRANDTERAMEGISRTEFWWKSSESRGITEKQSYFRVLEAEDLIEDESPGLSRQQYGCRYVHAEYNATANAITHFDGAIRAYNSDAYFKRLDLDIRKAGKQTIYTKLFRIDGQLSVETWKALTAFYFRGNSLVPEYLSGQNLARGGGWPAASSLSRKELVRQGRSGLKALLTYSPLEETAEPIHLCIDHSLVLGNKSIPYIETSQCAIGRWISSLFPLHNTHLLAYDDGVFNTPRIFVSGKQRAVNLRNILIGLDEAIKEDVRDVKISSISVSLS